MLKTVDNLWATLGELTALHKIPSCLIDIHIHKTLLKMMTNLHILSNIYNHPRSRPVALWSSPVKTHGNWWHSNSSALYTAVISIHAFELSALILLVERQEGHTACKN